MGMSKANKGEEKGCLPVDERQGFGQCCRYQTLHVGPAFDYKTVTTCLWNSGRFTELDNNCPSQTRPVSSFATDPDSLYSHRIFLHLVYVCCCAIQIDQSARRRLIRAKRLEIHLRTSGLVNQRWAAQTAPDGQSEARGNRWSK